MRQIRWWNKTCNETTQRLWKPSLQQNATTQKTLKNCVTIKKHVYDVGSHHEVSQRKLTKANTIDKVIVTKKIKLNPTAEQKATF